jgi:hypothetical protein
MYTATSCGKCDAVLYYPDEAVIGFWVYGDGRADRDNEFGALDWDDHQGTIPEGAKVYCLDCAPCECGDHERLVAHTAANITAWHGC